MDTITYTAARANLARNMDRVCNDHEPLIITRNGEQSVVLLSLEDYQALEATAYLLRVPANAKRLLSAIGYRAIAGGSGRGAEAGRVKLLFTDEAWQDDRYWQQQDRRMLERINRLLRNIERDPCAGPGKPEPLQHVLSGYGSRHITDEQRMVYRVLDDALALVQFRFHH